MKFLQHLLIPGLLFLAAACRPLPERIPLPTSQSIEVTIPPEIPAKYQDRLTDCAKESPQAALLVHANRAQNEPDLILQLGEPAAGFSGSATLLGREKILVVANPETPMGSISVEALAEIYTASPPAFEIWTYPSGHSLRAAFETSALAGKTVSPYAFLAADPEGMAERIADRQNALGYLPESFLSQNVKAAPMESQAQSLFDLPVLGITPTEPQGTVRSILVCMQAWGD